MMTRTQSSRHRGTKCCCTHGCREGHVWRLRAPGHAQSREGGRLPACLSDSSESSGRLHILRPGTGRRLGLASLETVSLQGGWREGVCGMLLHANVRVCAKVSALTLPVRCVRKRFPFVPMCCIFGRAAAREGSGGARTRKQHKNKSVLKWIQV